MVAEAQDKMARLPGGGIWASGAEERLVKGTLVKGGGRGPGQDGSMYVSNK